MAWRDGFEETRVLVAPESNAKGGGEGSLLSLRHPKSGSSTCYFIIDGSLQEFHWFKEPYGSWFLGDYVCEDGSLYTATPVDPVFVLLPVFEEARMKRGDDQGKFRQLDEILFVDGYPAYQHLLPIAEDCMQVVCETKEIGSSKFFRLNDSKVLAWLCCKVNRLKLTLPTLDKNYAAQDGRHTLIDAVSLLGEYLKDEPWLKLLCSHLKLDLLEVTKRGQENEIIPAGLESTPGSSHPLQVWDASQSSIPLFGNSSENVHFLTLPNIFHSFRKFYQGNTPIMSPAHAPVDNSRSDDSSSEDSISFLTNMIVLAQIGSDKKTSTSGKQAKKMKMETGSRNIQDMFRRASRRRS